MAFAASLIRDLRIGKRVAIDLARSLASIFRYLGPGIHTNARMILSARHKASCINADLESPISFTHALTTCQFVIMNYFAVGSAISLITYSVRNLAPEGGTMAV